LADAPFRAGNGFSIASAIEPSAGRLRIFANPFGDKFRPHKYTSTSVIYKFFFLIPTPTFVNTVLEDTGVNVAGSP